MQGSVAEWSKALDLGSSLSGGVGSNPTAVILFFLSESWAFQMNIILHLNNINNIIYVTIIFILFLRDINRLW